MSFNGLDRMAQNACPLLMNGCLQPSASSHTLGYCAPFFRFCQYAAVRRSPPMLLPLDAAVTMCTSRTLSKFSDRTFLRSEDIFL